MAVYVVTNCIASCVVGVYKTFLEAYRMVDGVKAKNVGNRAIITDANGCEYEVEAWEV